MSQDKDINYEKLYNKYKAKYLLLIRQNDTYKITKIDKLSDESETSPKSNTPDWPSISNKVRPSVVQVYSIDYEINPKYPYTSPKYPFLDAPCVASVSKYPYRGRPSASKGPQGWPQGSKIQEKKKTHQTEPQRRGPPKTRGLDPQS